MDGERERERDAALLAYLFKVNSEVLLLVVGDVPPLGRAVRPSSIPLGFVAPRVTDPTRLRYNVLRYRFFFWKFRAIIGWGAMRYLVWRLEKDHRNAKDILRTMRARNSNRKTCFKSSCAPPQHHDHKPDEWEFSASRGCLNSCLYNLN